MFCTKILYHVAGDQAREILIWANVPNASDATGLLPARDIKRLGIPLAVRRQRAERAVQFSRRPEQFMAQPLGIVARQGEGLGKDTGFVLALRVDGIERVIAQFCHIHERSISIWKSHMSEV